MELNYVRVYDSPCGGWIDVHPLHGKDELEGNLQTCKLLANKGYCLELLPVIYKDEVALRQMLLLDVFGNKNPDVRINKNIIADIKAPCKINVTKSSIKDAIYRAAQQRVEIVIIDLYKATYSFSVVKEGLLSALRPDRNKSIREIWLLTHDNNLLIIPRKMVNARKFYNVLDLL